MRTFRLAPALVFMVPLAACHDHPANTDAAKAPLAATPSLPTRRKGLWIETMGVGREGAPHLMGGQMRICVDAATDAKLSVVGRAVSRGACQRQALTRSEGGTYRYSATCALGHGGVMTATSTIRGDFASKYEVHTESDTTGASLAALNGHHVTDIAATWAGPCPPDLRPGDVDIGGIRLNIDHMPQTGPFAPQ